MSTPEAILVWVDQHDSAEITRSTQVMAEKGVQVVRCRFTQDLQEFLQNRQHLKHSPKLRIITNRVRTTDTGEENAEGLVQWLRTNGWLCPVLVYCGKPELCRNLELKYTNVLVSKSKTISRTFGCMEPCSFRRTGPVAVTGTSQPSQPKQSTPKIEQKPEQKPQKVEQKPIQLKPEPKIENKVEPQKKTPANGRAPEKKNKVSETDTSPSPSPPSSEDGFTSEDEDFPLLSMNEIDQIISEFDDMEGALEEKKNQDSSSDSDLYFSDDD
eukprot:TRINITY_DN3439_c0_g1_i1.p1 TRINITY_DN3439_c0_g1~~TRINITY_DN3439_c0_g1_i1.p1  ORF type:complete len:270 (-),score=61.66 TRINITY_DN3439_c0_g1_i1:231-1040(-)